MNLRKPRVRVLAITMVLFALFGLFIFYGSLGPAPDVNEYPNSDHLEEHPVALTSEQAEVWGTVVDTDPVVIQFGNGHQYVVEDAPKANVGQDLSLFVTVHEPATADTRGTLQSHDGVARDQWETTYMYVISIVAALWVLARGLRHWQLDIRRMAFVPTPSAATIRKKIREDGEVDG